MNSNQPRESDANQELARVQQELIKREPIFHRPELSHTRSDLENMMAADFWEVGASGRRYSREYVLNVLEKRRDEPHPEAWETSDFRCQRLAQDLYLLTYTLLQNRTRKTRRSTIWQQTADGWKIVFHQGTIVEDE